MNLKDFEKAHPFTAFGDAGLYTAEVPSLELSRQHRTLAGAVRRIVAARRSYFENSLPVDE